MKASDRIIRKRLKSVNTLFKLLNYSGELSVNFHKELGDLSEESAKVFGKEGSFYRRGDKTHYVKLCQINGMLITFTSNDWDGHFGRKAQRLFGLYHDP